MFARGSAPPAAAAAANAAKPNNTNNMSGHPLINVFTLVALTPATVHREYSSHYPVSLCRELRANSDQVSEKSNELCNALFSRFKSMSIISSSSNSYGLVVSVTTHDESRRFVIKFERLKEEINVHGVVVLIDRTDKVAKRDLISHVQLNRMPSQMLWNVILLCDWTRVRCNLSTWLTKFGCWDKTNPYHREKAPNYMTDYQVMVMERAAGTLQDLFAQTLTPPQPVYFSALVAQIFASLAQLHARLNFEHNDLTLSNVFYLPIGARHNNRNIYYQLPASMRWICVPLAATNNHVFKMSDFGLSVIEYYTTHQTSRVLQGTRTEWQSDFSDDPSVVEERFDLTFFLQNLANRFPTNEYIRQFYYFVLDQVDRTDDRASPTYDPERLFFDCPHLRVFVVQDRDFMTAERQATLEQQGHIVSYYCDVLSSEYREIDELVHC